MKDTEQSATTLSPGVQQDLEYMIKGHGLDSVTQGIGDFCAKQAEKHGVDDRRLTTEQRREARLWGFARTIYKRTLHDLLDHGPTSGCL